MTGGNKTVEPKKGSLSGSLSGKKKNNSAHKKVEIEEEFYAEDVFKFVKGRSPKIISVLTEKAKQTGGKLTWGDLDKIMQLFSPENDTDEIEEILSICEREGIEIIDEEFKFVELEDIDIQFDDFPLEEPENIDSDDIDMNFGYTRIDSGIRIDRYRGSAERVTIPARIDNLPVTSIGFRAFCWCENLRRINIPNSVTSIGDFGTFSDCTSLTSITIPNGVTSISYFAFSNCTSLSEINIPDSVISILGGAFSGCTSLKSIKLPEGVTSIGNSAFNGCTSLKEINIPNSVTSIRYEAFSGCTSLKSITLPDSVEEIGDGVFSGCRSLKNIIFPSRKYFKSEHLILEKKTSFEVRINSYLDVDSVISIPSVVNNLIVTSIGDSAFSGCTSLTEITLPEGVTSIDNSAFSGCTSLTEITLPEEVTSIGYSAFSGCTSLKTIYVSYSALSKEAVKLSIDDIIKENPSCEIVKH